MNAAKRIHLKADATDLSMAPFFEIRGFMGFAKEAALQAPADEKDDAIEAMEAGVTHIIRLHQKANPELAHL